MRALLLAFLVACCAPSSPHGRWRGDVADSDLIGACKQLRVCERSGLTTRGAGAQSWDRCSLRCGCDPDTVNDGKLFWSDPVCQP